MFSIKDPIAMMAISHPENKYFLIRLRYNIIITPNEKVDCLLYVKNRNMSDRTGRQTGQPRASCYCCHGNYG